MLRQGVRNKEEYAVGVPSNEQDGPNGVGPKSPRTGRPDRPSGEHAERAYYRPDANQRRRNSDTEYRSRIMYREVENAQATKNDESR